MIGDDDSHQYRCELRILCALIFIGWLTWPGFWWFLDTNAVPTLWESMWIVYQSAGPSAGKTSHSLPCGLVKCPAPAAVAISPTWEITKKKHGLMPNLHFPLKSPGFYFIFLWCHHFFQLIGAASKTLLANKGAPGRMTLPIICNTVHSLVINILRGVSSMAFSVITIVIHDG